MNAACPRPQEAVQNSEELTGLSPEESAHGARPGTTENMRPLSLAWITDDLLAHTQEVWSRAYGRPVTEDEAVEMLLNVKRLGETLMRAMGLVGDAR